MSWTKNRSEKRRQLRRRLEAQGYRPEQIERIVAQREAAAAARYRWQERQQPLVDEARERQQRLAAQEAALEDSRNVAPLPDSPDDSKYRPAQPDPLTVGVARVTGQTAKAARRGRTVTAWQHREAEQQ